MKVAITDLKTRMNEKRAIYEIRALDESVKLKTFRRRICDNREIEYHLTDFEKIDL